MRMGHWWNVNDGVKKKYWEKNLSQSHLIHHKCHIYWPGIKLTA